MTARFHLDIMRVALISYLPSDGEGLRSVGHAGYLERGALGHLLLRVDHHRLARSGTKIIDVTNSFI